LGWHVSCPGGCGYPYKASKEAAEWCFISAPGIFNRRT
jgi:hypothetical protein